MIKSLLLIICIYSFAQAQVITPYYILPAQTTQNAITSYSFLFYTDTAIASNAWVRINFPIEFDQSKLQLVSKIRYLTNGTQLLNATWRVSSSSFTIWIGQIQVGNITVVIDNVQNPNNDYSTSSYFSVSTLFTNVVVTSNSLFGRTSFTKTPSIYYLT